MLSVIKRTRLHDARVMSVMTYSAESWTLTTEIDGKRSARRDTNTARWLSKAEPKIFAPPQPPFPGAQGRPEFNQLEMVTTFSYGEGSDPR